MENGDGQRECECLPSNVVSQRRCSPENPYISIRKIVNLMENPLSVDLYDRQILILNDFIEATKYAYFVRDLPYVMRLFELLLRRLDKFCLFRKALKDLLYICSIPPLLCKSSDVLEYERDLQEYFAFLGYLLVHVHEVDLQELVLRALSELLIRKAPMYVSCLSLSATYKMMEGSRLPNVITKLLEVADDDLFAKLLKITVTLSNISATVCRKMLEEDIINILLVRLNPFRSEQSELALMSLKNFEFISAVLWKLLKVMQKNLEIVKVTPIPHVEALCALRYAFVNLTLEKGSEINRNHLMGILLQLIELFPGLRLIQVGLVDDISTLSVATEIGTGGTWASEIRFNAKEINYEFKKMLLLALYYCCKNEEILNVVQPKRIMPALLKLITPELSPLWHPQQLCKLTSLTFKILQLLVAAVPSEFLYYSGTVRLLIMIDYYNLEPYEEVSMLEDSLKTILHIASIKNSDILDNLVDYNADGILINLSNNLLSRESISLSHQKCLAYAFAILEILYQTYEPAEESSVHLCIKFLERMVNPPVNDMLYDPTFVICGISFFWEGVVGYKTNLKQFVSLGGVFKYLDLIQKSIFSLKLIGLAALVDMCEEGSCVAHLVTWRNDGQNLLSMLLEVFRRENEILGVKSTPEGIIADIEAPIMGQQQWFETHYGHKNPNGSPALVDLIASCRPKIYAIIQLLHNRHEKSVQIVNKHYKLYDIEKLSPEDQLTLLLAENFLGLKLGEAWVEVGNDLEQMGVRPITLDGEMLGILKRRSYKWALHLKMIQEEILKKEMKGHTTEERLLYNVLRDSKLIESLKALRELDYIARTTENMFRLVSKMKQTRDFEKGLHFTEGATHHRSCMHQIKVNPIFQQQISIITDIINPNEIEEELDVVSQESESDNKLEAEVTTVTFDTHPINFED